MCFSNALAFLIMKYLNCLSNVDCVCSVRIITDLGKILANLMIVL